MTRCTILMSLVVGFSFTAFAAADGSGSGGGGRSAGDEIEGRIESVTPTNFSVELHDRRHKNLTVIVVHYNPKSVTLTLDGRRVHSVDVKVTDMYASAVGRIVNNVLEATNIAITSSTPTHSGPIKSKNP